MAASNKSPITASVNRCVALNSLNEEATDTNMANGEQSKAEEKVFT